MKYQPAVSGAAPAAPRPRPRRALGSRGIAFTVWCFEGLGAQGFELGEGGLRFRVLGIVKIVQDLQGLCVCICVLKYEGCWRVLFFGLVSSGNALSCVHGVSLLSLGR